MVKHLFIYPLKYNPTVHKSGPNYLRPKLGRYLTLSENEIMLIKSQQIEQFITVQKKLLFKVFGRSKNLKVKLWKY